MKKLRRPWAIGIGIFLVLLAARIIYIVNDHRAFYPPADSWYTESRTGFPAWEQNLPESRYCVVPAAQQTAAQQMLAAKPFVRLNNQQAIQFWNGKIPVQPRGTQPFLVRGVDLDDNTRGFTVLWNPQNAALGVVHGSLGHYPSRMERRALMVYLPSTPKRVFVTVSRAA